MLQIDIKSIPDKDQRYNTVGDYQEGENHELAIRVSQMTDWRHELLVAVHELVEASLCKNKGITEEEIDTFDMEYEKKRVAGDVSEPGDDQNAPYYEQHQFANTIEKMLSDELGVDWEGYSREVTLLNKN